MSNTPSLFIPTSHNDRDAIEQLNNMFEDGAIAKAIDIQLRVEGSIMKVQYVGDTVVDVREIEGRDAKIMCERIKSRAGISQAESMSPRDGRFRLRYSREEGRRIDRNLDVRVSVIPTDAGETFTLRLLAEVSKDLSLDRIEMSNPIRHEFEAMMREQQGIVVVVGPVGSGKTTLLFTFLNILRAAGKNIKTIEDPIEIAMPGIDQMQVSEKLSFAQGVRAMVRQHLHTGLVGEVRDEETAAIAFRVGNTGSQIFFTIHADDSTMVIPRCEDLGIDRQTFAQSVRLIVFTRLISALPKGSDFQRVEPSEASRNWLEAAGLYDQNDRFIEAPDSAFTEKVSLFEVIKITPAMRRAIVNAKAPRDILEEAARQPQFETLAECAVRMAREGRTTLSAVQDLVGETVHPVHSRRLDKRLYAAGKLTAQQQFECVQQWGALRRQGKVVPLWKIIVDLQYASLEEIIDLIGQEASAGDRVAYFVERGFFTREDAAPLVARWRENGHADSIFKVLVQAGLVSPEQVYVESLLYFRRGGMAALD